MCRLGGLTGGVPFKGAGGPRLPRALLTWVGDACSEICGCFSPVSNEVRLTLNAPRLTAVL